jgi:hypothetical protein
MESEFQELRILLGKVTDRLPQEIRDLVYEFVCTSLPPVQIGAQHWITDNTTQKHTRMSTTRYRGYYSSWLLDPMIVGDVCASDVQTTYYSKSTFAVGVVPVTGASALLHTFLTKGHPSDPGRHNLLFHKKLRSLHVHMKCADWSIHWRFIPERRQRTIPDESTRRDIEKRLSLFLCMKGQTHTYIEFHLYTHFPEDRTSAEEYQFVFILEILRKLVRELKSSGVRIAVWHHNTNAHRNDRHQPSWATPACEIVSYFSIEPNVWTIMCRFMFIRLYSHRQARHKEVKADLCSLKEKPNGMLNQWPRLSIGNAESNSNTGMRETVMSIGGARCQRLRECQTSVLRCLDSETVPASSPWNSCACWIRVHTRSRL